MEEYMNSVNAFKSLHVRYNFRQSLKRYVYVRKLLPTILSPLDLSIANHFFMYVCKLILSNATCFQIESALFMSCSSYFHLASPIVLHHTQKWPDLKTSTSNSCLLSGPG